MVVEVLDLEDVFLIFLDGIGVSISYRKIVAITIFLAISASKISLVLVFLARLTLVDGKLLVLVTKCVSRGSVNRLSLFRVLLLLFCRLVFLRTP